MLVAYIPNAAQVPTLLEALEDILHPYSLSAASR